MIFEKVVTILADQLDLDENQITMESRLIEDLNADSLDVVDLIMTFEDEFNTEFLEEDAESLKTVADIVNYIESNQ